MIKLLWNTHNQKNSIDNIEDKEKAAREQVWGSYHKNNSNKWIYELLNNVKFEIIENEKNLENNDTLIIVDSNIENKEKFYERLKLICSKIFLIHLGDEYGSRSSDLIYKNFNYIFRTFCSNRFFNNEKIKCIPIGYKNGVLYKANNNRKYKWAFIGTPHKSSRHDLLYQFSEIKPFFSHKTEEFNKKIISTEEMSNILSLTEFIPCPNGFWHPETYRIYEALECECIPIVENAYSYYDRLFPNNPFLKVDKWADVKSIMKEWKKEQIFKKRNECKSWWKNYKKKLKNFLELKIK